MVEILREITVTVIMSWALEVVVLLVLVSLLLLLSSLVVVLHLLDGLLVLSVWVLSRLRISRFLRLVSRWLDSNRVEVGLV